MRFLMSVFPTGVKGFFIPVYQSNRSYSEHTQLNKVREAVESYLSPLNFTGLEGKVTGEGNVVQLEKAEAQPFYKTALKVASYALIIPLLVAIAIKACFRKKYTSEDNAIFRLEMWRRSTDSASNPGRDEAYKKIREFILDSEKTSLSLIGIQIKKLPDIFNDDVFQKRLKDFNLSDSGIETLPESMNLESLEHLSLSKTPLEGLPNSFNPPALKSLNLSGVKFTSLPSGFNPQSIQVLDLTGSEITSLPSEFNPQSLVLLHMNNTKIPSLPENFNPPRLARIYLAGSKLESFPQNFNPHNLSELFLEDSLLTTLPEGFHPSRLSILNFMGSNFRTIPDCVFSLPSECHVIVPSSIFPEERTRIEQLTSGVLYLGPRVHFDSLYDL